MSPTNITPSLKPLRGLLGRSGAGISSAYGAKSFTNRAQIAANKSSSPIHALHGKIGGIMKDIKKVDYRADRELHEGGFTQSRQNSIMRKLSQKNDMSSLEKKETKILLRAMTKEETASMRAPKVDHFSEKRKAFIKSATTREYEVERQTETEGMTQPHALASISQKKTGTAFKTYGDQTVHSTVGQEHKALGSISEKLSHVGGTKNISADIQNLKPASGGLSPISKPKY